MMDVVEFRAKYPELAPVTKEGKFEKKKYMEWCVKLLMEVDGKTKEEAETIAEKRCQWIVDWNKAYAKKKAN